MSDQTEFQKDIDIVGGIYTEEEGTVSGQLTIYGEKVEDTLIVKVGYGFDTPRFTVGEVTLADKSLERAWDFVCTRLESEPEYDAHGNVIPRRLTPDSGK